MTAPPLHNINTHSAQFMGAHPMATAVFLWIRSSGSRSARCSHPRISRGRIWIRRSKPRSRGNPKPRVKVTVQPQLRWTKERPPTWKATLNPPGGRTAADSRAILQRLIRRGERKGKQRQHQPRLGKQTSHGWWRCTSENGSISSSGARKPSDRRQSTLITSCCSAPSAPPHYRQNDTPDYELLEHGEAGYQTASSDVGPLSPSSSLPPSTKSAPSDPSRETSTASSDFGVDFASPDPLHFSSLLSFRLAFSILPEIGPRIVAKIKFWILSAPFTLPCHSDDLDEKLSAVGAGQKWSAEVAWDEKRRLVVEGDADAQGSGDGEPTAVMLSLPAVGAIAAASAALGFSVDVAVDGRAGVLTLRSMWTFYPLPSLFAPLCDLVVPMVSR